MMNTISQHLICFYHIPHFSPVIKEFSQRLENYLHQMYMLPLSYLDIYRIRKEFHTIQAIRYRLRTQKFILRVTDKSGIFHLGHAKDYERKAQAYREKTQAYIQLTDDNPLSTIFHKVVHLLNNLRSKKHILAGQLDKMMPRQDRVTLGYLYFVPKPHKVSHIRIKI